MTKPSLHKDNLQWLLKQSTDVKIDMLESHLDICRLIVDAVDGSQSDYWKPNKE